MITIDPPIEKLTDAQKIELIEQLEASLSDSLPEDWSPPQSHLDLLAERERRLESGEETLIELDDFIQQVRGERLQ